MVFSSIVFLFVFLPVVLLLYYITPKKFRNLLLFVVNLVFYGWGEPRFILLMLVSIVVNYVSGLLIGKFKNSGKQNLKAAKAVLITSIIVNIGLLVFFKYAGFIGNTLNIVLPFVNIPVMEIPLPIGISFYTFQTMSYVIDVYRNDAKAQKNIITFGTYVSLFPQLIAGPIVRYRDVETQLISRKENLTQFNNGVKLFVIGLCKKVLLANQMGALWDTLRENFTSGGILAAWFGICAYSLQIYFDFCGYSEMAMGLGNMLGFDFLKNFDYPYISKSITEFWRRWHISLSSWFREYIYIPLGGNRKGFPRQVFNMLVVWALTGLWHGANYNFILWGLYFFVILFLEKLFMLKALEKIPSAFQHIYSLLLIVLGWLIFYFEDMSQLWNYLCVMFGSSGVFVSAKALTDIISYLPLFAVAVFACTPVAKILYNKIPKNNFCFTLETIGCMCGLLLSTASLASSGYNPFLYFKF
ncbi:MAG: MBOAT family O-acyltransferase [Acutalibacteraceae bacterium]